MDEIDNIPIDAEAVERLPSHHERYANFRKHLRGMFYEQLGLTIRDCRFDKSIPVMGRNWDIPRVDIDDELQSFTLFYSKVKKILDSVDHKPNKYTDSRFLPPHTFAGKYKSGYDIMTAFDAAHAQLEQQAAPDRPVHLHGTTRRVVLGPWARLVGA